jgi:hypothetical protein
MIADYDIMHSGVYYPAGSKLPSEVVAAHGLANSLGNSLGNDEPAEPVAPPLPKKPSGTAV